MAMGLANRLMENGIRVPEDIIITGFDCVPESAINTACGGSGCAEGCGKAP